MFDGTPISMPDTVENQTAHHGPTSQALGVGFPLARVAAVFWLSCAAIVDLAIAAYSGKRQSEGQSEVTLLRQLWDVFRAGDELLVDSLMSNYRVLCTLQLRDVDVVTRLNKALRTTDFRRGQRLGKSDHRVTWTKPFVRDMDRNEHRGLPESLTVREVRFHVERQIFRSRESIVVTTLVDPEQFPIAELEISSLKVVLQIDVLRCKPPELVRKGIGTHVLAYNLIRAIVVQAVVKSERSSRTISFKAAVQILKAFQSFIDGRAFTRQPRDERYAHILDAIHVHRVGNLYPYQCRVYASRASFAIRCNPMHSLPRNSGRSTE